jgi:DNA-directed RNA polymerase specialized sigma24 family protein
MLEVLIADISVFPAASSDRIAVFKLYAKGYSDLQVAIEPAMSPFAWEQRASGNLSHVSPLARQAFLLSALEGFSTDEIGEILSLPASEATALLTRASEEISRQVATDILIIEDEPLIAMDIEQWCFRWGIA